MLRFSELSINFTFYQVMICRVFSTCSLNLYMLKISVVCHIIFLFIVYLLFPFFSFLYIFIHYHLRCIAHCLTNIYIFVHFSLCSIFQRPIYMYHVFFIFFANFVLFFIIFHLDFFLYFEFIIICCLYPMLVHCLRYFVKLSSI